MRTCRQRGCSPEDGLTAAPDNHDVALRRQLSQNGGNRLFVAAVAQFAFAGDRQCGRLAVGGRHQGLQAAGVRQGIGGAGDGRALEELLKE